MIIRMLAVMTMGHAGAMIADPAQMPGADLDVGMIMIASKVADRVVTTIKDQASDVDENKDVSKVAAQVVGMITGASMAVDRVVIMIKDHASDAGTIAAQVLGVDQTRGGFKAAAQAVGMTDAPMSTGGQIVGQTADTNKAMI